MPHGSQLRVSKNDVYDTSSMDWWVGVNWSGNLLNSAHYNIFLFFASSSDRVTPSTLSIKSKVLSKGLEEHDVVCVLSKEF